jgi:hypothetical protein
MVAGNCDKGQSSYSTTTRAQKRLRGIPDYLAGLRLRMLSLAPNF